MDKKMFCRTYAEPAWLGIQNIRTDRTCAIRCLLLKDLFMRRSTFAVSDSYVAREDACRIFSRVQITKFQVLDTADALFQDLGHL